MTHLPTMPTAIRITVLVASLLYRNVIGFAPITHSTYYGLTKEQHRITRVHAIDFKQRVGRVGSEVQSMFADVTSSLSSGVSNVTISTGGSLHIDETRNALERSMRASQSTRQYESSIVVDETNTADNDSWSYATFAREHPNVNNLAIASVKTAFADLVAQVGISHTPVSDIDWARTSLFFAFGFFYMGGFQYWYQVNVFKRIFDLDKFTSQSWSDKLKDKDGLISLGAQTLLDMSVSTVVYLPTFYMFQAAVFGGSSDPTVWISQTCDNLHDNFSKDELDLIRIWGPADLICFSVPLYLRLPSRHAVSFLYITYFSFLRCN